MSRIPKVEPREAGWLARIAFWFSRRKMKSRLGKAIAPGPLGVYAHHSGVLRAAGAFEMAAEGWDKVEPRLISLAQIRAAALIGCPF